MNKGKFAMAVGSAVLLLGMGWVARGRFGIEAGSDPSPAGMPGMMPATVRVQTVQTTQIPMESAIIARVEPVQTAHIRAELSARITGVHFTEGSRVEEGDALFSLESDQYRATVTAGEAEYERAKAETERARSYLARLMGADTRSVSRAALETAESDLLRAEAGVQLARANLTLARIALARTDIRAPISGRIGAAHVTRGNIVTPASGTLATIVQMDPIRVRFALPDREFLQLRRDLPAGEGAARTARLRLADGTVLAAVGEMDFADNVMDPETGAIAVRYLFANPDEQLVPGSYVTILLAKPEKGEGVAIPQKAVLTDTQGPYVLTVTPDNIVAFVRITTGVQVGSDIVVLSGLQPGNRVIVEGTQRAYPGFPVQAVPAEDRK